MKFHHTGTSWDTVAHRVMASFNTGRGGYQNRFFVQQVCYTGEDKNDFDKIVEKINTALQKE